MTEEFRGRSFFIMSLALLEASPPSCSILLSSSILGSMPVALSSLPFWYSLTSTFTAASYSPETSSSFFLLFSLIDAIEKKYSHAAARDFIDNVSRLALEVISKKGFSISSGDEDISEKSKKKLEEVSGEYDAAVKVLVKEYQKGKEDKATGMDPRMLLESRILQLGGEASNKASDIIKKDLPLNSSVIMAISGARGSYVNLTQMCAFVGQEALEGERIHRGFIG